MHVKSLKVVYLNDGQFLTVFTKRAEALVLKNATGNNSLG